jgi:hypothetical protein
MLFETLKNQDKRILELFRLFTFYRAIASIELKPKTEHSYFIVNNTSVTLRSLWQQKRRNWCHTFRGTYFNKILLPKKRFDLKSNRQYFDLKSHLDHARKNDLIRSKIIKKMI